MAETSVDQSADKAPLENGVSNHVNGSSKSHKSSSSSAHHSSSKHGSSSSSHKDGKSSSSDKHRSSSSSDKHRSDKSSSDRHRDEKTSSDKHRSSSSSNPHSSSKSEHKSSSSSRPKDGSSSGSAKHHSSSRDKDRHRDDKERSKDDKDKDRKDKDRKPDNRPKDKPKESGGSGFDRDFKKTGSSSSLKPRESSSKIVNDERKMTIKTETIVKNEADNDFRLTARLDSPKQEMTSPVKVKQEPVPLKGSPRVMSESEDDVPLSSRKSLGDSAKRDRKRVVDDEDSDDEPLTIRAKKVKKEEHVKAKKRPSDAGGQDSKAKKAKIDPETPKKKGKKGDEEQEVWKWWEEGKRNDGVKWKFLEHKGPLFAPLYERLPKNIKFYYNGEHMVLSEPSEEVAGFYAKMLEHDYTTKDVFNNNFFKDWRKVMAKDEQQKITDLKKCNFKEMHAYFTMKSEEKKALPKEEKKKLKEANEAIIKEYGFCKMDGHMEKIGNFRIEPPGLFRGRGDHPKQGKLKTRIMPEDIIINCSKDSKIPQPPKGRKWKEVRHDNTVTWLCSWTESIQGSVKYIMLNASSRLKGEKDWQKYEVARKLKKVVNKIRANYTEDFKSKEMRVRQRAVAMYFIDKLALRAGNEKEDGETADTVGCCSLRVEHITLHEHKGGKDFVVEFDFLGKDSIRYYNSVPVEKRVFKNLERFKEGKNNGDDLFDRLNTTILNKHLQDLMEGLTAKVFRTYNASKTLQDQLDLLTVDDDPVTSKMLSYNRANRAVAVLCNHQRAAPKNFDKQMENLQAKIDGKNEAIRECKREVKAAKSDYKNSHSEKNKSAYERKKTQLQRLEEQLTKLEVQQTDKDENKEIALGTSKLNYLDPRISVAWCKKHEVPLEKIYNKTQRDKFRWAIDMAGPDFVF